MGKRSSDPSFREVVSQTRERRLRWQADAPPVRSACCVSRRPSRVAPGGPCTARVRQACATTSSPTRSRILKGSSSGTSLAVARMHVSTRHGARRRGASRGQRAHPPEVAPPGRRPALREARPRGAVRRPRPGGVHRIVAPAVHLRVAPRVGAAVCTEALSPVTILVSKNSDQTCRGIHQSPE